MHDSNIVHRDLKPENMVISHVTIFLFRESAKSATSDGQLSVKTEDKLIVALWTMFLLNLLKAPVMTVESIYGPLELWPMNSCVESLHFMISADKEQLKRSRMYIFH